jgi:DNA-binding HxlR family transcriptional regulator
LRGLAVVISSYLRTDNLGKALGQLSGRRYDSWRSLLQKMYRLRRPVRAGELIKEGVFSQPNTADNALKQLVERGMLERTIEGALAYYELTWIGEQVARFLMEQEPTDEPAREDDSRAQSASASPAGAAYASPAGEPAAKTAPGGEETVGAITRTFTFASL